MNGLTPKQKEVLQFICDFSDEHGFPPTVREVGDHFQMASSSALDHLRALEKKGYIRRSPFRSRCLEVLKKAA